MSLVDPLSRRTTSAYPLSIGTSLALESVFITEEPSYDPERQIPQVVDISQYDEFWVNLATLFRNILGALSKEDYDRVGALAIADTLSQEIEVIESLLAIEGNNVTRLVLYACEYKEASSTREHPYALLRGDSTDKQKVYRKLLDDSISIYLKQNKGSEKVRVLDSTLKPKVRCKALILTHIAYDLTSYKNFTTLDLIESHTGVLKKRHQWYTKYQNGKELPMIPFNKAFLQVFGDSEHFRPMDIRFRRQILEIAKEHHWTQVTTDAKILANIDQMKDHYSREILKKILLG